MARDDSAPSATVIAKHVTLTISLYKNIKHAVAISLLRMRSLRYEIIPFSFFHIHITWLVMTFILFASAGEKPAEAKKSA